MRLVFRTAISVIAVALLSVAVTRLVPELQAGLMPRGWFSRLSITNIPSTSPTSASPSAALATTGAMAENASSPSLRGPIVALSHGGGPLPLTGDPDSAELAKSLQTRVPKILRLDDADPARRPEAIVLVTAHWTTATPAISSGSRHKLLFDYYGFPPETYEYRYEAPGSPELARELAGIVRASAPQLGEPVLDAARGWDHGVFVPLLLVRPQADVPVLQVSVLRSEDPDAHLALGRALGELQRRHGGRVAVVGSGFASFHNLRLLFSGATEDRSFRRRNEEWSRAVTAAATAPAGPERDALFRAWRSWPGAYESHPRGGAEHFLPLVVCAGAAEGGGEGEGQAAGAVGTRKGRFYKDRAMGLDIYSYYWE